MCQTTLATTLPGRGGSNRAGTAHRPAGESDARITTGPLRQIPIPTSYQRGRELLVLQLTLSLATPYRRMPSPLLKVLIDVGLEPSPLGPLRPKTGALAVAPSRQDRIQYITPPVPAMYGPARIAPWQSPNWLNTNKTLRRTFFQSDRCTAHSCSRHAGLEPVHLQDHLAGAA